tara:strand:+ start:612 stop:1028 length:417 start_codon:yes stop_codon:yes gene_type:complete
MLAPYIYVDSHKRSFAELVTVVMVLIVLVLGIVRSNLLSTVLALLVATFVWFTTPFKYYIFHNRIIVAYGLPRRKAIPIGDIKEFGIAKLPMGMRLVIRRKTGRMILLSPVNLEAFQEKLSEVVATYRAQNSEKDELL